MTMKSACKMRDWDAEVDIEKRQWTPSNNKPGLKVYFNVGQFGSDLN